MAEYQLRLRDSTVGTLGSAEADEFHAGEFGIRGERGIVTRQRLQVALGRLHVQWGVLFVLVGYLEATGVQAERHRAVRHFALPHQFPQGRLEGRGDGCRVFHEIVVVAAVQFTDECGTLLGNGVAVIVLGDTGEIAWLAEVVDREAVFHPRCHGNEWLDAEGFQVGIETHRAGDAVREFPVHPANGLGGGRRCSFRIDGRLHGKLEGVSLAQFAVTQRNVGLALGLDSRTRDSRGHGGGQPTLQCENAIRHDVAPRWGCHLPLRHVAGADPCESIPFATRSGKGESVGHELLPLLSPRVW